MKVHVTGKIKDSMGVFYDIFSIVLIKSVLRRKNSFDRLRVVILNHEVLIDYRR